MTAPQGSSVSLSRGKLITLGVVGVLVVLLIAGLVQYNGVRKNAINRERQLNAQYQSNQAELSAYKAGAQEQFSIAEAQATRINQIIEDAVKGRYEGDTTAEPGRGQLFSAIIEAYPGQDLPIYNRIVDYIQAKREAYKNLQQKLLDQISAYENYVDESIFRAPFLRSFPSHRLEARIGRDVKHGREALDQMKLIVLTPEAKEAYERGEEDPLEFQPGDK